MNRTSRQPRPLALDKPCKVCGEPVHYAYSGPIEGVCGRCTDRRRGRRARAYHKGMVVPRPQPGRRSTASAIVLISVVMVVGAVAVAYVLNQLLG